METCFSPAIRKLLEDCWDNYDCYALQDGRLMSDRVLVEDFLQRLELWNLDSMEININFARISKATYKQLVLELSMYPGIEELKERIMDGYHFLVPR